VSNTVIRYVVASAIGLLLAFYAYQRVTDPRSAMQRAEEEAAVLAARDILRGYVGPGNALQIVDPLAPDRAVGKVYVYPADSGWDVSGHYRRDHSDRWHPFLMRLDAGRSLVSLSVQDARLRTRAAGDPKLTVSP
jgi:hypothetical protein